MRTVGLRLGDFVLAGGASWRLEARTADLAFMGSWRAGAQAEVRYCTHEYIVN
jgi:hypothetical protein